MTTKAKVKSKDTSQPEQPSQTQGTPQDGTVRLPRVDPQGNQVEDYSESTKSLHPLDEAS